MPFNVNKCHILQVGTRNKNKKIEHEINGTKLDSLQCVKDLGVLVAFIASNSPSNAKTPQVKLIECWVSKTEISRLKLKI